MLLIAFIGLLIGLSKGGLGPLVIALILPLLSQFMPVSQAAATPLPLLLVGDVFALWVYWQRWDIRYIRLMLPLAGVGVFVGTFILVNLSNETLRTLLGLFTLLAAVYKIASDRLTQMTYQPRLWHGRLAGFAAGFGSAVANAGAYPFTAYLLLQKPDPTTFLGTTTLFFAVVNVIKLVVQRNLIAPTEINHLILAMPLVPLGVWLGRRFIERVNPQAFNTFMIVTLVLASLMLLFWRP